MKKRTYLDCFCILILINTYSSLLQTWPWQKKNEMMMAEVRSLEYLQYAVNHGEASQVFLFLRLLWRCWGVLIGQTSSSYIKQNSKTLQSSIPLVLCKDKAVVHRRTIESPDVAACTASIREEERNMCATFTLHQITTSATSEHTPVAGGLSVCLSVTSSLSQWKGENSDSSLTCIDHWDERAACGNAPAT